MTQIIRHLAGPGCGKTTKLLEFIRSEVCDNGIELHDLYYLTFARSQCEDAKARIKSIFPDVDEKRLNDRVKTFHGGCNSHLRACGYFVKDRDDLIFETGKGKKHFAIFAQNVGLPYKPGMGDPLDDDNEDIFIQGEIPLGNLFFAISRYMVSTMTPWDWWPNACEGMRIPVDKTRLSTDLFVKWAEYKRMNHLWEHDDYLQYTLDTETLIDPKVLLIDEFQDLSPVQFRIFEMWASSGLIEKIFVAGDPNQAIYAFRGCNPDFLRKLIACDTWTVGEEMPVSHRCPSNIVDVADRVLQDQSYIKPRCDGGNVEIFDSGEEYVEDQLNEVAKMVVDLQKKHGEIMILCRFRKHAKRISDALTSRGIPNKSIRENRFKAWRTMKNEGYEDVDVPSVISFLKTLRIYRSGFDSRDIGKQIFVTVREIKEILKLIKRPDTPITSYPLYRLTNPLNDDDKVPMTDVIKTFASPSTITYESIIGNFHIPVRYEGIKRGIESYIRSESTIPLDSILIDTIHQSKGCESPAVILFTAFHKNRADDCYSSISLMEEERRVFYVGITRAIEHVTIVHRPKLTGVVAPVMYDVVNDGGLCHV